MSITIKTFNSSSDSDSDSLTHLANPTLHYGHAAIRFVGCFSEFIYIYNIMKLNNTAFEVVYITEM